MTQNDNQPRQYDDQILVAKYGSSSISSSNGIDNAKICKYASKLQDLKSDYRIVIVSSGSVSSGRAFMDDDGSNDDSIYAMAGSAALVVAWQKAFEKYGTKAGQILVTHNDIDDKMEGGRLQLIIREALGKGIIPIVNENDVLSDVELAMLRYGGDNDGLASEIAVTIGATELLLLTDVDGLIDESGAVLKNIDADNYKKSLTLICSKSGNGRGGMRSKIEAAARANKAGVRVHIGDASADYRSLLAGDIGTHVSL